MNYHKLLGGGSEHSVNIILKHQEIVSSIGIAKMHLQSGCSCRVLPCNMGALDVKKGWNWWSHGKCEEKNK